MSELYSNPGATKLTLLWSNLIHYANFGHAIHPEPETTWELDVDRSRPDILTVKPVRATS